MTNNAFETAWYNIIVGIFISRQLKRQNGVLDFSATFWLISPDSDLVNFSLQPNFLTHIDEFRLVTYNYSMIAINLEFILLFSVNKKFTKKTDN